MWVDVAWCGLAWVGVAWCGLVWVGVAWCVKRYGHFFNKGASLRPETLLKKRLWHRCFPVNFVKFLKTLFLRNISGRMLLEK